MNVAIWIACGSILINAHIIKAENCQQNMTAETSKHVPVKKYMSGYQFW